MKLLNKLLPITTIGAVACVVTPLVTSCGAGTTKVDLQDVLENGFERKTEYKTAGDLEKVKATETYLTDLKSNTRILVDDIFEDIFGTKGNEKIPKEVKGSIGLKVSDVNPTDKRLSLALDANISADNCKIEGTDIVLDGKVSASIAIKNILVDVNYIEEDGWILHSGYDLEGQTEYEWLEKLQADDKWSFTAKGSINGVFAGIDGNADFNITLNSKSYIGFIEEFAWDFDAPIPLPYLKNQTAK